jgi:hypothetical protein
MSSTRYQPSWLEINIGGQPFCIVDAKHNQGLIDSKQQILQGDCLPFAIIYNGKIVDDEGHLLPIAELRKKAQRNFESRKDDVDFLYDTMKTEIPDFENDLRQYILYERTLPFPDDFFTEDQLRKYIRNNFQEFKCHDLNERNFFIDSLSKLQLDFFSKYILSGKQKLSTDVVDSFSENQKAMIAFEWYKNKMIQPQHWCTQIDIICLADELMREIVVYRKGEDGELQSIPVIPKKKNGQTQISVFYQMTPTADCKSTFGHYYAIYGISDDGSKKFRVNIQKYATMLLKKGDDIVISEVCFCKLLTLF